MAEIEVQMPDGTVLAFPDSMSQQDIAAQAQSWWASNSGGQQVAETPTYTPPEGYEVQETDRGRFLVSPQGQWTPIEVDGQVDPIAERAVAQNQGDLARADTINRRAQSIDAGGDTFGGGPANFLRGAPFVGSYTDEALGGAVNALTGRTDAVQQSRDITDAYAVARPGRSLTANVAGGVTGAIPLAAAAAPSIMARSAQTLGGKALQAAGLGAAVGGAEGAVYGSGLSGSEGPGASRSENAAQSAALGAGIGGAVGAAAPYVGAGVRNLAQRTKQLLTGSDVNQIARELGVSREAATVIRNAVTSSDDAAQSVARGGDQAMLADANMATQSLLDTAAQAPGAAGQVARGAVTDRVQQSTQRMTQALDEALGAPTGSGGLVRDIMQDSSPARQQAYDRAFAQAIDYSSAEGRRIEAVLRRVDPTVMNRAIQEANAQMRDLGITNQQIRATIGDSGEVVFDNMPDVRQLDAIKQALDSVAEGSKNVQGIMSAEGRRAADQARTLRTVLGRTIPEYDEAVKLGGQAIAERNAVQLGRDMLTARMTREQLADGLQGASQAERTAAMQGLRSYIDDVTANISRTITDSDAEAREGIRLLRDMSSRANRSKITQLLGPREANDLLSTIDEAATGFELRAAIAQNSRTAGRQMTAEGVREQTSGGVLRTLAQSEPVNATKRLVQAITGETPEAQALREMGLYQEISEALVNTTGSRARRAVSLIERATAGQALTEQQARFIANVIVGSSSAAAPTVGRDTLNTLSRQ